MFLCKNTLPQKHGCGGGGRIDKEQTQQVALSALIVILRYEKQREKQEHV